MALSKEEIQSISRTVISALDSRRSVPEEQHHEDHDWLTDLKKKSEEKAAMWRTLKTRAFGWAIVAALTGLASGIWWIFRQVWAVGHKINGG